MRKNVLVDSGFWFALYKPKDQKEQHFQAQKIAEILGNNVVLVPFPSLYEFLNTRFVKQALSEFKIILKTHRVDLIDDTKYKYLAHQSLLENPKIMHRGLSLVDVVLRLMLDDVNLKVDCLVTFNIADFHDVCKLRNIELLS